MYSRQKQLWKTCMTTIFNIIDFKNIFVVKWPLLNGQSADIFNGYVCLSGLKEKFRLFRICLI